MFWVNVLGCLFVTRAYSQSRTVATLRIQSIRAALAWYLLVRTYLLHYSPVQYLLTLRRILLAISAGKMKEPVFIEIRAVS